MRFLFVDRILALSPGSVIKGSKQIKAEDAYLTQDAQGKSCFIPSLIGETLGQLAAWNVMYHNDFTLRPVAGIVSSAQLHRPAYVGEQLILESYIDSLDDTAVAYHSVARVGDELVFTIDGALGPLLPMQDFISDSDIRNQFASFDNCQYSPLSQPASSNGVHPITMTFDSIISYEPGVSLIAEKRVLGTEPFFPDHFPRKLVLPLTVLLECKLNLAKDFVSLSKFPVAYQVGEFRKIKMSEFVTPGSVIRTYIKVKEQTEKQLILSYRSEVEGKRVCVVDVVLFRVG